MEANFKVLNFIGGKFVEPRAKAYLDNFNPATGQVYSSIPDSDADDVADAVTAAKAAFPVWSKMTRQDRANILYKIADLLEANLEKFARAESRDQGKPVWLARSVDIPRACYNFRFFAGAVLHHTEMASEIDGVSINYTQRFPVGVAGLISPWNLPLYLLTWKIAPALAMGNTCVCKPSEMTSVTAWMLGDILNQAGLPAGTVNLVFGLGAKCGAALVGHPEVPLISFTGGTVTASHIIKQSAPYYKKLGLELGGKNPNIIFDDADLEDCLNTSVRSSFLNQGEICLCGSRIFVQAGVYDKFVERFVELARNWKAGDPSATEGVQMGPLISREHRDKVEGYIKLARELGGDVLVGGDRPHFEGEQAHLNEGYFLNPTVIVGLDSCSRLNQEEIFGPVVTIVKFSTESEVVEYANSVQYGLSASIWTMDAKRAHRSALALNCGMVWVNCWMLRDLRMPFGGTKASGLGREGGAGSLDFFSEQKTIYMKFA